MKNKKVLISSLLIIIVLAGFLFIRNLQKSKRVIITTDKTEYKIADSLKIKIKNSLEKTVCFSSCYPYLLEKQSLNGEWEKYLYIECEKEDITEDCIEPKEIKAFEILSEREKGLHRLILPACIGCKLNESFREDKIFYSNKFIIK